MEDHAQAEVHEPDCSSITDAHNNEPLNMWIEELDSRLDLKENMPDDHAKQVSDCMLLGC